jgi:hypothetical protein
MTEMTLMLKLTHERKLHPTALPVNSPCAYFFLGRNKMFVSGSEKTVELGRD